MLHKLNPVRLGYIRAQINLHFGVDAKALKPLTGMTALDVGCGAGLLTEPLARMGAAVTGVDAAPENIAAAKVHADAQGLSIDYRACEIAEVRGEFDLITAMEVIEHVTDPAAFIESSPRPARSALAFQRPSAFSTRSAAPRPSDRKSTRLNSSHLDLSRMPSSA